jgi:hypothetical protein
MSLGLRVHGSGLGDGTDTQPPPSESGPYDRQCHPGCTGPTLWTCFGTGREYIRVGLQRKRPVFDAPETIQSVEPSVPTAASGPAKESGDIPLLEECPQQCGQPVLA